MSSLNQSLFVPLHNGFFGPDGQRALRTDQGMADSLVLCSTVRLSSAAFPAFQTGLFWSQKSCVRSANLATGGRVLAVSVQLTASRLQVPERPAVRFRAHPERRTVRTMPRHCSRVNRFMGLWQTGRSVCYTVCYFLRTPNFSSSCPGQSFDRRSGQSQGAAGCTVSQST